MDNSPSGNGSLASLGSKPSEWKKIHVREYNSMIAESESFRLLTGKQKEEIAILRRENGQKDKEIFQKDREIRRLSALCEQRGRDLSEMEEWITSLKPVMDENERKLKQQGRTIVELSRTVKKLKDVAITLLLVVFTQVNSHWLNFTFSYHLKLLLP